MRWTRQRRARGRDRRAGRKIRERSSSARDERRCCGRRSRVVLTPVAGVKSRGGFVGPTGRVKPSNSRGDGDKKELVAGEITKETVKTIAQGRPDDPPTPVVTTVCFLPLHTGHGCGGHPAFPAPSLFRGTRLQHQLGRIAPRARRHIDRHSGAMRKHRTRNLEIPRCAIAHLRSGPSDHPGMTVSTSARIAF